MGTFLDFDYIITCGVEMPTVSNKTMKDAFLPLQMNDIWTSPFVKFCCYRVSDWPEGRNKINHISRFTELQKTSS